MNQGFAFIVINAIQKQHEQRYIKRNFRPVFMCGPQPLGRLHDQGGQDLFRLHRRRQTAAAAATTSAAAAVPRQQ